jgi:hypothetical protein
MPQDCTNEYTRYKQKVNDLWFYTYLKDSQLCDHHAQVNLSTFYYDGYNKQQMLKHRVTEINLSTPTTSNPKFDKAKTNRRKKKKKTIFCGFKIL